MLTRSELESLSQWGKESVAYAKKAFAQREPKSPPVTGPRDLTPKEIADPRRARLEARKVTREFFPNARYLDEPKEE
jgi:hypothetical protein